MTVKELITELKKCNPEDIVEFNDLEEMTPGMIEDVVYSIDDVQIGWGTQKGFVYLVEKP